MHTKIETVTFLVLCVLLNFNTNVVFVTVQIFFFKFLPNKNMIFSFSLWKYTLIHKLVNDA